MEVTSSSSCENRPHVLTIAIEDTVGGFVPSRWRTLADIQVGRHMFETLVCYDEHLNVISGLASFWRAFDRGRQWQFRIRHGATFHDGTPVDAEAVIWNLRSRILPRYDLLQWVSSISGEDDSVCVKLTRRFPPFLARLASPQAVLIAPHRNGNYLQEVGSGPFTLSSSQSSAGIDLVRRFRDEPGSRADRFQTLRFIPMANGSDMWSGLCRGQVDVIYECPYEVVRTRQVPNGLIRQVSPSLSVNMLILNTRSGVCASRSFRGLIARGINQQELLQKVNLGVGEVARGPISPASPFYVEGNQHELTWETKVNEKERPQALHVLASNEYNSQWLALFVSQLTLVGIESTIRQLPFAELLTRVRCGEFESALLGVGGSPDPDELLFELFHSYGQANFSGISDSVLDLLIERGRFAWDREKRRRLYGRALSRLSESMPAIFLRHGASIVFHNAQIAGLNAFPDNYLRLENAHILTKDELSL